MKKGSMLAMLIGIVAALAALAAVGTALLLYLDKKKDDEGVGDYPGCSHR